MSMTQVTHFHAAAGQEHLLIELLTEGRNRMRAAAGCDSFDLFEREDDARAVMFIQHWASHEAHDAAFAERIVQTGHLEKVLAILDEPITQHAYQTVS